MKIIMKIIEINNLTKNYGKIKALNNINISIEKGELFGLLGPNGAGKSTMIKTLTGQIKQSSGSVKVLDIEVTNDPIKVRELVGIIPEQETPPSFLTAEEYLYFVAKIRKLDKIDEHVNKWFKLLEFDDQRDLLCKNLSRGTRQKLMFSQAFIHEPKVAFIDEPLVNLDPISQKIVKDFLTSEIKKGNSIFLSTHDLNIAHEICTTVCILNKGEIVYNGKNKGNLEKFFIETVKKNEHA
jgi:ABC-2 type transport system ATP-binding protein